MGAWGMGPFENDDASDWLYELEVARNSTILENALNAVVQNSDPYLEASDCTVALAACEILAALRGKPADSLPEEAETWIQQHKNTEADELIVLAEAAIERMRTNSELKELWEESRELDDWLKTLDDLLMRLRA